MDVFSRTFLPAISVADLPVPPISRHFPVLRRCVTPDDTMVLVARCYRSTPPTAGAGLLLLTDHHLVVTRETRVLRQVQLHLATELRHLSHVVWTPDPRRRAVELAATVVDGVRERFWIRAGGTRRVAGLDALLSRVFRPTVGSGAPRLASG